MKRKQIRSTRPVRYVSRKRIAKLFDLPSSHKTYELFPVDAGASIPEDVVVEFLNEHRAGGMPPVDRIPQLVSDRSIAKSGMVLRDDKPVTVVRLRAMCRRVRFPVPHYRFSDRRFAFTPDAVDWWQSQLRSGTYVNQRRYIPA